MKFVTRTLAVAALAGGLGLLSVETGSAMELNLNKPYGLKTSPPAVPELAFYSEGSRDLLFENGPVEIRCRVGVHSVGMRWSLARNFFKKPFRQAVAEAQPENVYVIRLTTEGLHPGFYDLRVSLDTGDGKTIEGLCVFGFKPAQMAVQDSRPADFRAFWDKALAKLAAVPLDPRAGELRRFKGKEIDDYNLKSAALPGDYDPSGHACEEVEACKVEFSSVNGKRIHAWLAKPLGDGPFPAMLVLPGGGFASRPIPLEHARHGYLAIDIQIHGQEVDLEEYPQIPGYFKDFVFAPTEANYAHDMYLGAVQAVNYLLSRGDVDKRRVAAVGGSQGGRLSVTTAALHPQVKAIIPAIAHYGNVPYLKWAEASNAATPQKDGMDMAGPPPLTDTTENKCCAYYDVMNFAPDVKCPVLMNAGLVDPVSLASGVFAIHQRLGSANTWMIPLPGLGHDWSAEFDRRAWRWLERVLGTASGAEVSPSLDRLAGPPAEKRAPELEFHTADPVAPAGLAGLVRDQFAHGRLNAIVGAHGGLLEINYWGRQPLGRSTFFRADSDSAWTKMFRVRVRIDGKDYYLGLRDTRLLPFGYRSQCTIQGITFSHELILLEDSLVQRARVLQNPRRAKVQFELVHMESCCAVGGGDRQWSEFGWREADNSLVASCADPAAPAHSNAGDINQKGMEIVVAEPAATTWVGVGCDASLDARRGYNPRSKWYLSSKPVEGNDAAFFLTFAADEARLTRRLAELRRTVHKESDSLLAAHEEALAGRPKIAAGDPVLDSAFAQYPQVIHSMKLPDLPGAVRANIGGYFLWGWDGMTPMVPLDLANEASYTAQILRFWKSAATPELGIPLQLTTLGKPRLAEAFPAQCQYIASLYHYVAATGDLGLAREIFPFCARILELSRRREVKDTGLVEGAALWPDFPQAMGEDGNDISTLNNSLLYQGLRAMEYLAGALGEPAKAAAYAEWAARLRASFVKYLYDEEQGYFISSCSSLDFKPRKHYIVHALFWITPFARELAAHAPARIAGFMNRHLATGECLLSLPRWDTAWMADGNQIGASFPTADYFYLNVHKLIGDDTALETWLGHVKWFWQTHTAPEAFTPEAENERDLGPDNPGGKQLQAVTCWYAGAHQALAGMDIDHEGFTFTPWGDRPVDIRNLHLRGTVIDLSIRGRGRHIGSLKLNGKALPTGSRKIVWDALGEKSARLELERTEKRPAHPVIVRADGLRVSGVAAAPGRLQAVIEGSMSGELAVQAPHGAKVFLDGRETDCIWEPEAGTLIVPVSGKRTAVDVRGGVEGAEGEARHGK